jgi:hypothetical protein
MAFSCLLLYRWVKRSDFQLRGIERLLLQSTSVIKRWANGLRGCYQAEEGQEGQAKQGGVWHCSAIEYV